MPGPPFYVTTPIYYVNDVPHIGHAYTTVAGRRAHPLAPALRRRRLLPHRHRRARPQGPAGGRGAGASRPQELGRSDERAVPRRVGRCSTSRTTTSSAPPSPATTRRCRSSCSAIYDTGDIELGTYEGLYCVSCEAYYTEDELVDGNCPIHGRPVEHVTEENYFFKLSRFEDRLLEYYAAHPEAVQPDTRRNEVLGFIRRRPAGLLDEPHVDHVGHPAAVGPEARRVRVGRRAVQLLHRGRLRRRPTRASRSGGRSTTTSSARTSCASTRCTGPRC